MPNHPNRNWRKRWKVDLAACEAKHETGLVVQFVADPSGGWSGNSPNANEWFQVDPGKRTKIAARLMREAGEIYKEALDKRQ